MEDKQLKLGSLLSYLQMGVSIVIGLLYTPFMLNVLGKNEYGLYSTITSTMGLLNILTVGFNSAYMFYYAKQDKEDDSNLKKINGMFLIVLTFLGVVALFLGLFISNNLELFFSDGLTASEYKLAKKLSLLLIISLSVSFPLSVFNNMVIAHERFVFAKLINIIRTIISPSFSFVLLLLGYKSIALVLVTVIVTFCIDSTFCFYAIFKLKQRFDFRNLSKGDILGIFKYTVYIAIHFIVDQINWNIDKLLLGRFKGTEVVAIYSVAFTLFQYYSTFSAPVSSVFIPRIHLIVKNYEEDTVKRNILLTNLFIKVGNVQFVILSLLLLGIVFFGKHFIGYWAGSGYDDSYYILLLLAIPATVDLIQNLGIEIQRALNTHKFRAFLYLITAVLNFIISIFLAQKYGAIGCAIGTAVSYIITQGVLMNVYYHKKCGINIVLFWKSILRLCFGLIIPSMFGIIFNIFIIFDSVIKLLITIILFTIIYIISIYLLGLNKEKREAVKKFVREFITRGK